MKHTQELNPSTVHGWLHGVKHKDKIIEIKKMREQQKKIKDLKLQV